MAQHRFLALALTALAFLPGLAAADADPAPPYPPPPPPVSRPYPIRRPPPPMVESAPPPLSPVMRVLYAPFYAAGLVVRYGVYYALVAPLEVFERTVTYGAEGGVEPPPPPTPPRTGS